MKKFITKNLDRAASLLATKNLLEFLAAWLVAFFALLFSVWTLGSHAATFFKIPWFIYSSAAIYTSIFFLIIAAKLAAIFSENYCFEIERKRININLPNNFVFISLLIAIAALFFFGEYKTKFLIATIEIFTIWFLSKNDIYTPITQTTEGDKKNNIARDCFALLALIGIAIGFTLCAHRPDLDDSSFIQIAAQTLTYQDRAPLSYDASLGQILETFRFAPYRISSYETLIAFVSERTGISLLSVYYLVMPGITATLTILVAFIFSRWFVLENSAAIMMTAVFLLIIFAWGDSHRTYGNFVFVRLFQGKGLIIALTTPFATIAGLLLIRSPSFFNALILAMANICAIGVSSSGLVMAIFTSLIVAIAASNTRGIQKLVFLYILIATTISYPAILVFWIKFQSNSEVPLNEVGSYSSINTSLGLNFRESSVLSALLLGCSIYITDKTKGYFWLVSAIILFIINPWFSDWISHVTSRNMSWRLAWAAPVPLLMSIGIVAALRIGTNKIRISYHIGVVSLSTRLISIGLLFLFLFSYRWGSSSGNNVEWGYPSAKLPTEFYTSSAIANKIRALNLKGSVLAHPNIAAWLPLTLPSVPLVMPGHTYPIQLQTILPPSDFNSRMKLFIAIRSDAPNLAFVKKEMRKFNVVLVVLADGTPPLNMFNSITYEDNLYLNKLESIGGYSLFSVYYGDVDE